MTIQDHDTGMLAVCGKTILIGYEDGRFESFETDTLTSVNDKQLVRGMPPHVMATSPNNEKCAVLLHDRTLFGFTTSSKTVGLTHRCVAKKILRPLLERCQRTSGC